MSTAPARLVLPARCSAILFDLDGTISESGAIIVATLRATLAEMGLPGIGPDAARRVVGPPLGLTLAEVVGVPADRIPAVIRRYRELLRPALADTPAYPGMVELVRDLHAAGLPLAVATSKVTTAAVPVIEAHGLSACFAAVCGSPPDEVTGTKAAVVGAALARLGELGYDVSRAVMVGDRHHDIEGAGAHGVPTIAVTWGYGEPAEWAEAAATVATPAELRALLWPAS